jgi:hypothetical protein
MQDFCIHHKATLSQHILGLQSSAKEQSLKPFPKNFNVDVNLSSCFKSFMILFVPSICNTLNLPRIAKSWLVDMHTICGVQPPILVFLDVYRKVVTKYLTKIVGDFQ